MARFHGLLSHSSVQVTRSWTAYSSFEIVDLVFSLWSHTNLLFMSAVSCRVNFHYFVDFVGCPCMISNHDFISGNSNQSTHYLRVLIHSNLSSFWSNRGMQKTFTIVHCRPVHVSQVVNVSRTHFRSPTTIDCSFMAASGEWTFKRNPNLACTCHGCS